MEANETTETPTTTTTTKALEWITRAVHEYIDGAVRSRYPGGPNHALVFSPGARIRIASILGWIHGIAMAGRTDLAAELADAFLGQLDDLDVFGGRLGTDTAQPTRYVIELSDDGTLHGFSVLWFARVPEARARELDAARREECAGSIPWRGDLALREHGLSYGNVTHRARFAFNGGLLYHGPGHGETFSVVCGNARPWMLHT